MKFFRSRTEAPMKFALLVGTSCLILGSNVLAQTTQLNGSSLLYRSTGSSSSQAWVLDRDGYLGTYITLSAPGNVTVSVRAEGTASGGVKSHRNVGVGGPPPGVDVEDGGHNYSSPPLLAA